MRSVECMFSSGDSGSRPHVSICIPVYNIERYVREAIESALRQTYDNFELVIIDDGSTDGTAEIVAEMAESDGRIRFFQRPHRGVSRTANELIRLARGEFIARLDGDDIATPDRLSQQVDFLRAHPKCVAVGSRVLLVDEQGLPLYEMPDVQFGHEDIDATLLAAGWSIAQGATTFRRQAIIDAGGYREDLSLHEDHDLFLRLSELGALENVPKVLTKYRQRLGSIAFTERDATRAVMNGIISDAHRRRGIGMMRDLPQLSRIGAAAVRSRPLARCRHWGWMSLKAHHRPAARKYAWEGFRRAPFSPMSLRLLYCALRGH